MSTFTVDIGPEFWKPQGLPAAGDLVFLAIIEPQTTITGPSGWTMAGGGAFWRVFDPQDSTVLTFYAAHAGRWELRGYVIQAGTYELPDLS